MTIRLAKSPITLQAGGIAAILKPSLRAGFIMAEKWTLAELDKGIAELDFPMICSIAALGADDPVKALRIFALEVADRKAIPRLQVHIPAIREFVSRSLGLVDHDDSKPGAVTGATAEPNLIERLTELFEFATGVLHWTPADTWAATPAEIISAQRGHLAYMNQLHGAGTNKPTQAESYTTDRLKRVEQLGYDPAFDRDAFNSLKQKGSA
ncbi:phage tail assembly chaperone [Rhizobium sp. TRM95796]|uniref:phage tail assembly chaperone n=1 Tax=Rhizobium sp. TRM95796 TaxID=2979862 RepID=UPI0021E998DE|nr:phage tail assembly chaperone [Rhizobium sp. TRM95796]MCV3766479.1 phage tail assembly chaperone [Rhizobium sp. TRM95796]